MQDHIEYLKCPIHSSQYIQLICLTCTTNSLACPLCLDASHNLHQVISIKKFMVHEVPKLYDQKPELGSLTKMIDNLSKIFSHYVEKLRKEVGHQINQLELHLKDSADTLKQELLFVCGDYNARNLHENVEAAKLMIKKKNKIEKEEQIRVKLAEMQTKMSESVHECCIEIRRMIQRLRSTYDHCQQILLNSKVISNFKFCETYRHPAIQVKAEGLLAFNKSFDNVYHSCVVVPPLCPFHQRVTFQIKKSDHKCIWLGVADLRVLTELGFQNTYKGEGANYWIWQAGGDDEAEIYGENSENRPLVGWNFETGDRISLQIEFSPDGKKTLHITKNGDSSLRYSRPIDDSVGSYYACVSLGDEEESVSIINEGQ